MFLYRIQFIGPAMVHFFRHPLSVQRLPCRTLTLLTLLCVSAVVPGFAPDAVNAQLVSGPGVGSSLEPLKVVVAAGDNAGQQVDFADDQKSKPTLFVFVQDASWDRPIARFLKTLDQSLDKEQPDAKIIVIWLTEDVDKAKDYLPKAQQSLKMVRTIWAVYPGDKQGPAGWGINSNAHVTIIVAHDQKVTSSMAHRSVNETEVPAVLKELKPKN